MTTYAGTLTGNPYLDLSQSSEAQNISDIRNMKSMPNSFFDMEYRKRLILDGLTNALTEAAEENREAYIAFLNNTNSLAYAAGFLAHLPADFPFPEISLDNDGDIAIDWDYEPRRIMSISVGKDGTLNFAWLVGYSKQHGIETFKNNIPESILTGIQRVLGIR